MDCNISDNPSFSDEFKKIENFVVRYHGSYSEPNRPLRLYIQLVIEEAEKFFNKSQKNVCTDNQSYIEYKGISLPICVDKFFKIPIRKLLWQGKFDEESFPRNITCLITQTLRCCIDRSKKKYEESHGIPPNLLYNDEIDWNFYRTIMGPISNLLDLTDIPITYAAHKTFGVHNGHETEERIEKQIHKRLWKLIKNKRIYELLGLSAFQLQLEKQPVDGLEEVF